MGYSSPSSRLFSFSFLLLSFWTIKTIRRGRGDYRGDRKVKGLRGKLCKSLITTK